MKTGESIKELRLKKGITQEDLSAKTDISVRTIQRIENNDVEPRPYTLQSIAAALDVDFETLVGENNVVNEQLHIENRRWLPIIHLSGLLILIIPPVIVWIWKRDQLPGIRKHAYDVINFQLSMSLYLLPCFLFGIYPILVILVVYSQVMILLNSIKVADDQTYRYPLSIRFLKA